MSNSMQEDHAEKQSRWQFRKRKKIEKRRKKRQMLAEKNKPLIDETLETSRSNTASIAEKQTYEKDKLLWEEREQKFKLIELAKAKAKQKEEAAKDLAQKRWQETLMSLPLLPPKFIVNKVPTTVKTSTASPIKIFIPSTKSSAKMTYRDRFLERKKAKEQHRKK